MQKTRDELKRARTVTRRRAKYLNERRPLKHLRSWRMDEILLNGNKDAEVEFKKRILVSRKKKKRLKNSAIYKSKEEENIWISKQVWRAGK